jgi:Protein of unknown function (DUF4058)
MPMHDWTKVPDGIFHAFHHRWITAISDTLNANMLPRTLYALPEQVAGGFGPDVLTLQVEEEDDSAEGSGGGVATATRVLQPRPVSKITAQTEAEFYRRKKSAIAIRHVSGDRVVAMIEIVSPGNKASKNAVRSFVNKACELLEARIHLLLVDPFPPAPSRPRWRSRSHLGRGDRHRVPPARGQAAHARRLRVGHHHSRLPTEHRGRRQTSRHGVVPRTERLRDGPARSDLQHRVRRATAPLA